MSPSFSPKLVAPGEGKTVMLFGVRFSYKVVSTDSGGSLAALEVEWCAAGLDSDPAAASLICQYPRRRELAGLCRGAHVVGPVGAG